MQCLFFEIWRRELCETFIREPCITENWSCMRFQATLRFMNVSEKSARQHARFRQTFSKVWEGSPLPSRFVWNPSPQRTFSSNMKISFSRPSPAETGFLAWVFLQKDRNGNPEVHPCCLNFGTWQFMEGDNLSSRVIWSSSHQKHKQLKETNLLNM